MSNPLFVVSTEAAALSAGDSSSTAGPGVQSNRQRRRKEDKKTKQAGKAEREAFFASKAEAQSLSDGSSAPAMNIQSRRVVGDEDMDDCRPEGYDSKGAGNNQIADFLDQANTPVEILNYVSQKLGQFTIGNVVAALYAIAQRSDGRHSFRLLEDPRFLMLLDIASQQCAKITKSRDVSRVIWSLGKVECRGPSAQRIVAHVSNVAPPQLLEFTDQDLRTTLWGLARLGEWSGPRQGQRNITFLALAIVTDSHRRLMENPSSTPARCLASSIWAIAKLGLKGEIVEGFQHACITEMCGRLSEFSQQSLANSLWACAKLKIKSEVALQFCLGVTQESLAQLPTFQAQELSMSVWGAATIMGNLKARLANAKQAALTIKNYVLAAALEASKRLHEFAPQGISNIAWAIATMKLQRDKSGKRFLLEAMRQVEPRLRDFPPQAISNLCWAVSTTYTTAKQEVSPHDAEAYRAFSAAVANEAMNRRSQFEWQDLSCILVFLSKSEASSVREQEIAFAEHIMGEALVHCANIGTQALLNIAVAGLRLGCDRQVLSTLIQEIAGSRKIDEFNDQDLRQWQEVHEYCFAGNQNQHQNHNTVPHVIKGKGKSRGRRGNADPQNSHGAASIISDHNSVAGSGYAGSLDMTTRDDDLSSIPSELNISPRTLMRCHEEAKLMFLNQQSMLNGGPPGNLHPFPLEMPNAMSNPMLHPAAGQNLDHSWDTWSRPGVQDNYACASGPPNQDWDNSDFGSDFGQWSSMPTSGINTKLPGAPLNFADNGRTQIDLPGGYPSADISRMLPPQDQLNRFVPPGDHGMLSSGMLPMDSADLGAPGLWSSQGFLPLNNPGFNPAPLADNQIDQAAGSGRAGASAPNEARTAGDKKEKLKKIPEVITEWSEDCTTVVVRNLPNKYKVEDLLRLLNEADYMDSIDYVYIAMDFHTGANKGYCFLNFLHPHDRKQFVHDFHNRSLPLAGDALKLSPAATQGLETNVLSFIKKKARRVTNKWFRPFIIRKNPKGRKNCVALTDEVAEALGFLPPKNSLAPFQPSKYLGPDAELKGLDQIIQEVPKNRRERLMERPPGFDAYSSPAALPALRYEEQQPAPMPAGELNAIAFDHLRYIEQAGYELGQSLNQQRRIDTRNLVDELSRPVTIGDPRNLVDELSRPVTIGDPYENQLAQSMYQQGLSGPLSSAHGSSRPIPIRDTVEQEADPLSAAMEADVLAFLGADGSDSEEEEEKAKSASVQNGAHNGGGNTLWAYQ